MVNWHMWELKVCSPLVVDGNGCGCEIESLMSASNPPEGIAEDRGRDSILDRSRLPSDLVLNARQARTYHRGELEIRFNLETSMLGYQCPLLLP